MTRSRRAALSTGAAALAVAALGVIVTEPAYAGEQPSNSQGSTTEQTGGGDATGIYAAARTTYSAYHS